MSENKTEAPEKTSNNSKSYQKQIKTVTFLDIFRFADKKDKFLIAIGTFAALLNGAAVPIIGVLFGDVSEDYNNASDIMEVAQTYALRFLGLGLATFLLSYISYSFWVITGENQGFKFRREYFRAFLRQEIGYYDSINPNEIASKVQTDCFDIQNGIGDKMFSFFFALSNTVVGFLIAFVRGWQLTLVLATTIPALGATGGAFVAAWQKIDFQKNRAYAPAGALAEECFNSIRTVSSLNGYRKEHKKYYNMLFDVKKAVFSMFVKGGFSLGLMNFSTFATWALGFYFGSKLIEDGTINSYSGKAYNTGDVMTVFFSTMVGTNSIIQLVPGLRAISGAKLAATRAFSIIDRKSEIDITVETGLKPTGTQGKIEFEHVFFAYPNKKDRIVLEDLNFEIPMYKKTAFVGESGCGKTTAMQLLERFYDIEGGSIKIHAKMIGGYHIVKLDGIDIRNLNLSWLRSQIGYVGQEPILFATTLRDNMLFVKEDATDEEIWEALDKANALEFIQALPQKLDTYVGVGGVQLSGGQKQRVAIARAILKNPPILLLDEATSALDRKNERDIQYTLNEISQGRTTIVIAHRLSTIQDADKIVVFHHGKIAEEGTHDQLMKFQGKYFELSKSQQTDDNYHEESAHRLITKRTTRNYSLLDENKSRENSILVKSSPTKTIDLNESEARLLRKAFSIKMHPKVKNLENPTAEVDTNKKKEDEKTSIKRVGILKLMYRLLTYKKVQNRIIIYAFIGSIINGTLSPLVSVYMGNLLEILSLPDKADFRTQTNRFCLYFIFNALAAFISNIISVVFYSLNTESLTLELRGDMFEKFLKMPISWHDDPENKPGTLATKLAYDTRQINKLASSTLGVLIAAFSTLITGLIIGFVTSWRLTLCSIAFMPIFIYADFYQTKIAQGMALRYDKDYKESGSFLSEIVINMRTVASFGKESMLIKNFERRIQGPQSKSVKQGLKSGFAFGFSQFVIFCKYAYLFYLGAVFLRNGQDGYGDIFKCVFALSFTASSIAIAFQYIPDITQARLATERFYSIYDSKPEIDYDDPEQTIKTPIKGDIEFKDVWFKYPTRDTYTLKEFSIRIPCCSKTALVGPSGCGKSTLINLLLRLYDPQKGEIFVNGVNIKKYDLAHLRNSFGYVSQEPVLFNTTIEENIRYLKPDATEAEIREAALKANCLKFIEANDFESSDAVHPEALQKYGAGFKRLVGTRGCQISGGQKQRIAIARAIMHKPSILLLDEATSALDVENERLVQESLDNEMKSGTMITVAHRITTIKDANLILVFKDGVVVEQGTYSELSTKEGFFYKLERGIEI